MNILAPAYDRIVRLLGRYSLLIFTALWLLVDSTHIFFLDIRAVCFWGIGCCFAKNNFSLSSFDRMNKALLSVLYIGLTAAYGVLIGSESVIESVIYRLGLTVGIVFWYVCATGLKGIPKKWVLFISRYSFLIYLFHELNLTALKKLLAGLLPLTIPFQIAEYFCVPCIILLFCTGLSIMLERIAPGVFVVLNGGRALRYTKSR